MKNVVKALVILVVFVGAMAFGGYVDGTYTMKATVAEEADGFKYLVDAKGEAWEDDRACDFVTGEEVTVTFVHNHTHTRYDDVIIKVK